MQYRYTTSQFADVLRTAIPTLADYDLTDEALVQQYFESNPDPEQMALVAPIALPPTVEVEKTPVPTTVLTEDQYLAWEEARGLYRLLGDKAAAGFWKQLSTNIGKHVDSMPSFFVGLSGYIADKLGFDETGASWIESSENLRHAAVERQNEAMMKDPELMALELWMEDEDFFTMDDFLENQWSYMKLGFASGLPSIMEMAAVAATTYGVGTAATLLRGGVKAYQAAKPALQMISKGSAFTTAMGLEGSSQWNDAMAYAEEQGMDQKEASNIAGWSSLLYMPIAGALEYFPLARIGKKFGLGKVSQRELSDIITGKVIKNRLARGGWEGLKGAMIEAGTEFSQNMTQRLIQTGYEEGYGQGSNEILGNMWKTVGKEALSKESKLSTYAGFLTGGGYSIPSGIVNTGEKGIRARINKMVDDGDGEYAQLIFDEATKDLSENKKIEWEASLFGDRFGLDKEQVLKNDQDAKVIAQDVNPMHVTRDERDSAIDDYLTSLVVDDYKFTQEDLTEIPVKTNNRDTTPEEAILYDFAINYRGKKSYNKLLSLIKEDKTGNILGNIVRHDKSRELLTLAVVGIAVSDGLPAGTDLSEVTENQLSNIVALFQKKGKIVPIKTATLGEPELFEVEYSNVSLEEWLGTGLLPEQSAQDANDYVDQQGYKPGTDEYNNFMDAHTKSQTFTKEQIEAGINVSNQAFQEEFGYPEYVPTAEELAGEEDQATGEEIDKTIAGDKTALTPEQFEKKQEIKVDTIKDKKGRVWTYFKKITEKAGIKTTKFIFNRSDKGKDHRSKSGAVSPEKALGDKFEVNQEFVPEGATVTKVYEIREGETGAAATVEFTDEDGDTYKGGVQLIKKQKKGIKEEGTLFDMSTKEVEDQVHSNFDSMESKLFDEVLGELIKKHGTDVDAITRGILSYPNLNKAIPSGVGIAGLKRLIELKSAPKDVLSPKKQVKVERQVLAPVQTGETYKGLEVLEQEEIPTTKDTPVAARYDRDEKKILISTPALTKKFEDKAWTKPVKQKDGSSATGLHEDSFKTIEDFKKFTLEHEYQHSVTEQEPWESRGQYEDRINELALFGKSAKLKYAKELGYNTWSHVLNSVNKRRVEKGLEPVPVTPAEFKKLRRNTILAASEESESAQYELHIRKELLEAGQTKEELQTKFRKKMYPEGEVSKPEDEKVTEKPIPKDLKGIPISDDTPSDIIEDAKRAARVAKSAQKELFAEDDIDTETGEPLTTAPEQTGAEIGGDPLALIPDPGEQLEEATPALTAEQKVAEYLSPMERVEFPPAESREKAHAIVDGKEVPLTEDQKDALEKVRKGKASGVKLVQATADVLLLDIGRELIKQHGEEKKGVKKIISGGQIGADQFGLEIGQELGIETGGTAPPGYQTSKGKQKDKLEAFGLTEGEPDIKTYPKRTKANVMNSDGTVLFGNEKSPGSKLTRGLALGNNKPYLANPTVEQLSKWLSDNNIKTLNIAGNRKVSPRMKDVLREALGGVSAPKPITKDVSPLQQRKIDTQKKKAKLKARQKIPMTPEQGRFILDVIDAHKMFLNRGSETTLALEEGVKQGIISPKQVVPILRRIEFLEGQGELGTVEAEYFHEVFTAQKRGEQKGQPEKKSSRADSIGGIELQSIRKTGWFASQGEPADTQVWDFDWTSFKQTMRELPAMKSLVAVAKKITSTPMHRGYVRKVGLTPDEIALVKKYGISVTNMKADARKILHAWVVINKVSDEGGRDHKTMQDLELRLPHYLKQYGIAELYSGISTQPKATTAPKVWEKIKNRLKKKYPSIDVTEVEKLIIDGDPVAGAAIGNAVAWSKTDATLDTAPHEYGHVYVNMLANNRIVKAGIKKFGSKEKLVQYIGEYYANRLTGSTRKRVEMWLKKFWLEVKNLFGMIQEDELGELIAGRFYQEGETILSLRGGRRSLLANAGFETQPTDRENGWNSSDIFMTSHWETKLGIHFFNDDYRAMMKLAKDNVNDFENFTKEWDKFFKEKGVEAPVDFLHQFFNKSNAKIDIFDPLERPGGRLHFEAITNAKGETILSYKGTTKYTVDEKDPRNPTVTQRFELATGNRVPLTAISNFREEQGFGERTIILSMSDVVKERTNYSTNKKYWAKSDITAGSDQVVEWQRDFVRDFDDPQSSEKNLITFVGMKTGNQGMLVFAKVNPEYASYTYEQFIKYLDNEIKNGNITTKQRANFIRSATDGTIIKDQRIIEDYRQIIGRHEWWKDTKGNKYLIGTHLGNTIEKTLSIQDFYNRLRIDMTEGYVPRGMGDSTIMTVDDDVEIWMDGKKLDIMDDYDGWMIESGTWFKRLHERLGISDLAQVKGVIRVLEKADDESGTDNYIGTKMMQMTAFNRMEFRRAGETEAFARVSGTGFSNRIIDLKTGKTIDHLSAAHTSKMTAGRFSEFYTLQTIPETSQKIIQVQEHSKNTAAFPVTWGELAMDSKIMGSKEGRAFVSALNKHYKSIMNDYFDAFNGFLDDPKSLWEEMKQELQDGQVQTQFQEYLDVIGEGGEGMHHTQVSDFWINMLKKRFFTHGMFKMRQKEKGKATSLFFKPKVNLDIPKQRISVSQKNSTLVNHVTDLVKNDKAWISQYLLEANKIRRENGEPVLKYWDQSYNDKITGLNQYLKTHKVELLLSRQPVAKLTGVVLRRLHSFVKSKHGETLFANPEDIIKVFDGDWDGDKSMVEIITDNEVIEAFRNFRNSDIWKKKRKAVSLKILDNTGTTHDMSNASHMHFVINQISSAEKTIGMITNARNTMFSLGIKNFRLDMGAMGYTAFKPTDPVILDYVNIKVREKPDKNGNRELIMTQEAWNDLYEQGDSIVNRNLDKEYKVEDYGKFMEAYQIDRTNKFNLKTTKEHELSILLQMAVDDAKFGFLGQIRINPDFIYSRIFKNNDGASVASMLGDPRKNIQSAFNDIIKNPMSVLKTIRRLMNFSPIRQGINQDDQTAMDIYQLFAASQKVHQRLNDTKDVESGEVIKTAGEKLMEKVHQEMKIRNQTPVLIDNISFETILTPQERIIVSLYMRKRDTSLDNSIVNGNLPITYTESAGKQAHQLAASSLLRRQKGYLLDPKNQKTIENAVSYMEKLAADYFDLIDEILLERQHVKGDINTIEIKYDYSEPFALLTDKHRPAFDALTEEEQMVATLYWLNGVSTVDASGTKRIAVYRMRLPPMKLLHKETMRGYFKNWWEKLRGLRKGYKQPSAQKVKEIRAAEGLPNFEAVRIGISNQIKNLCGGK